jgi:Na+/proline symporter
MAYPAMLRFLPAGLLGLMVAGLLSAYISTITTHLNWGTSYLVHDVYRRFVRGDAGEKHYVMVGRIVTGLLMVAAGSLTFVLESARQNFELMLSVGAGTGLLYLLRWFWWRVNAWSEIAAMVSSFAVAVTFFLMGKAGNPVAGHIVLLSTVAITTVVWVTVTLVTAPASRETLASFYSLVRPAGPGWAPIRAATNLPPSSDSPANALLGWSAGVAFVYSALFGSGAVLHGAWPQATAWVVVFVVSGVVLRRVLVGMFAGGEK